MSAICPTCNSKLSCGCQKRTASNGAQVCTLCITKYEAELAAKKNQQANNNNAPSNVQATYQPPRT